MSLLFIDVKRLHYSVSSKMPVRVYSIYSNSKVFEIVQKFTFIPIVLVTSSTIPLSLHAPTLSFAEF